MLKKSNLVIVTILSIAFSFAAYARPLHTYALPEDGGGCIEFESGYPGTETADDIEGPCPEDRIAAGFDLNDLAVYEFNSRINEENVKSVIGAVIANYNRMKLIGQAPLLKAAKSPAEKAAVRAFFRLSKVKFLKAFLKNDLVQLQKAKVSAADINALYAPIILDPKFDDPAGTAGFRLWWGRLIYGFGIDLSGISHNRQDWI